MSEQNENIENNENTPIIPIESVKSLSESSNPPMNFNRKFRRMLLKSSGYVKMKNRLVYRDWFENINTNSQNGKQLHASNTEDVIKAHRNGLDSINESTAKHLTEKGFSEELTAKILEKNMEVQERIARKKIRK